MKKKILLLLIAGAMVVTMLTSCSNSGETNAADAKDMEKTDELNQNRDLTDEESSDEPAEPTEDELIIEFISSGEGDVVCGIWHTQYLVGSIISNGENYHLNENEVLVVYVKNTDSITVSFTGPIFENTRAITENIILREFKEEEFDHVIFAINEGDTELFSVTFTTEIILEAETEEIVETVEIPEGLTYNDFIIYLISETDLGDCDFIIWNPEIGSGRVITGETVSMNTDEKLIMYNGSMDRIDFEIITGDVNIKPWDWDLRLEVNSPGEITMKVVFESTGEEFEITCTIE